MSIFQGRFRQILLLSLLINALIIGILLYVYFEKPIGNKNPQDFNALQKKYPLVSKRILLDLPQDILINFLDLRKEIRKQTEPLDGKFAVYFEYLPTGTSIGVSEKTEFHAASLFKVPVVMAYFHYLERTGSKDKIVEIKESELDSSFGNLYKKGAGYKIKLSEAVRLALVESDNTAARIISSNISVEDFDPIYNGLDVDLRADINGAIVTAKNYSSVLKALYYTAVLSRDSSQKILELLSQTNFPDKLEAGIPKDIIVAHKIGDYINDDSESVYSDCGIIYLPRRTYVLCMMSVGDEQLARERMRKMSKTVYDFVSYNK